MLNGLPLMCTPPSLTQATHGPALDGVYWQEYEPSMLSSTVCGISMRQSNQSLEVGSDNLPLPGQNTAAQKTEILRRIYA